MGKTVATAKKSGSFFRISLVMGNRARYLPRIYSPRCFMWGQRGHFKNLAQLGKCPTAQKLPETPQDTSGQTECHEAHFWSQTKWSLKCNHYWCLCAHMCTLTFMGSGLGMPWKSGQLSLHWVSLANWPIYSGDYPALATHLSIVTYWGFKCFNYCI